MTDPHSPRKHDHLVEPMYAGLGVDSGGQAGGARTRWLVWGFAALVIALAAILVS